MPASWFRCERANCTSIIARQAGRRESRPCSQPIRLFRLSRTAKGFILGTMPTSSRAWLQLSKEVPHARTKPSSRRLTALRPPRPLVNQTASGKSRMHVQVRDYQTTNGPRDSLVVPGPAEGEFYHVRAPDNRRSTARHNSIGAPNPRGFSGNLTTGCQFSHWRAVVWRVPNAPRCAFGRMTSRPKMGIKVCAILLRDAADPTA
jgi:hypothetical protein